MHHTGETLHMDQNDKLIPIAGIGFQMGVDGCSRKIVWAAVLLSNRHVCSLALKFQFESNF